MKNSKRKHFTGTHKTLHGMLGLAMIVLFLTGFLRLYWMSKKTVIHAIDTRLSIEGISLDKQVTKDIAKSILEPMWQWHEYAAYVVFGVLVLRLSYMLLRGIRFPNPFAKQALLKERLQGVIYLLFYLFVGVSVFTGAYLKWSGGAWKEPLEMIHKWAVYWFPIFIVLHFVGILIAEFSKDKGIVSKMISGDD